MFGWVWSIDIPSLVLGAALGAVTSTWHSYYVRRPKLRVIGSGSGGGSFYHNRITISNSPGLLGVRLPETTIFNKNIHSDIEIGLPVDRNPARNCRAWLYDKETNRGIAQLWWQTIDGKMTREVTLESGEQADLMLFARLKDEKRKYFVYQVESSNNPNLKIPDDEDKLDETREILYQNHSLPPKKNNKNPMCNQERFRWQIPI